LQTNSSIHALLQTFLPQKPRQCWSLHFWWLRPDWAVRINLNAGTLKEE